MRLQARLVLALSLPMFLVATHASAEGLKLPDKTDLLKTLKADVGLASQSIMPPWPGQKWEYLSAPLAKFDASGLGNPVTSVAAAIANSFIDDGVRLHNSVVSLQYLGDHGYELISIHDGVAYFKRPKPETKL